MGQLTTHVLDTMHGRPAEGVALRLYSLGKERRLVASATTNIDGRSVAPLIQDELMPTGTYELEFDMGEYFRPLNADVGEPGFLETVVIRFAVRADERYHVPLLATPWSYSTYRGS